MKRAIFIFFLYFQFTFGCIKSSLQSKTCVKVNSKSFGQYDFIIVGAGTSGCVLANRLTENPTWKVLLIEAGGNETEKMDIPMNARDLRGTDADWQYTTVPNGKSCLAFTDNVCQLPRGKVLGGSSTTNSMVLTRGNRRDYDNWKKMGNREWGYDDVLPYFKKLERVMIPNLGNDVKYRSRDGKVAFSYIPFRTPIAEAINKANADFGIPDDVDYNAFEQTSTSFIQAELLNGSRDSANTAYIQPILNRNNLEILQNTLVTKILINPKSKITCGVEFIMGNKNYYATVSKEVILSAGAINSPQLLMLSGIGPKDHLKEIGIKQIHELNVGDNLMDHPSVKSITFLVNDSVTIIEKRNLSEALNLYHDKKEGPYTLLDGLEVISFINTKQPKERDTYPNIEYCGIGWSPLSGKKQYGNLKDDIYETIYKPYENHDAWVGLVILLRPKSRGKLRLRNKDPISKPLIDPNFMGDEEDLETIVDGIRILFDINKSNYLQKYGSHFLNITLPACKEYQFDSRDYWRCYVYNFVSTNHHACGTCKMGPRLDKTAVVSPQLKVHGVKRLRIIDASIMPEIPAGHTNAPVFMIAEKGADIIKEEWKSY